MVRIEVTDDYIVFMVKQQQQEPRKHKNHSQKTVTLKFVPTNPN